ncbi:MAG: CPBP family intramembrane metalloprotease [Crocosphaera sp.]|nr:CPBP family intramembrane metalloprotease [Crocosphaera sp.]
MAVIISKNCFGIASFLGEWKVIQSSDFGSWLIFLRHFPSGSKIALFLLIWWLLWLPIGLVLGKKLNWQPFQPLSSGQKIPLLIPLYLLVPLLTWFTLAVEGTSIKEYGLGFDGGVLISLCQGIFLGLSGLTVVFVLEGGLGWLKWHPENLIELVKIAFPILALALWIALTEEFVFRGIFQTILESDYGRWISAITISLIFALLHLLWERKETLAQLPGLWLMGMVLVMARWVDGGSIGLAWGLHAGWIWGLSSLDAAQLISYTGKGKDWIIGIYQQPLAGIMGILCLLGTSILLCYWPYWGISAIN